MVNFKIASYVVKVHSVVEEIIRASRRSEKEMNVKIGDELMQMTRAVVKKHTFQPKNAYKYHLAQPSRMLSRSVVHWNKAILRRRPNGSSPWTVKFQRHVPLEVFACFKAASLREEGGGLLVKNSKHVEKIQFHVGAALRVFLLEFANKYKKRLSLTEIMCKIEKDDSYSMVITNQGHPAVWHYSKNLEIMRFTARYGHYNRLGVPQFTL